MMKIFSQPFFVLLFFVNDSKQLVPLSSGKRYLSEAAQWVWGTMVTLNREIFR